LPVTFATTRPRSSFRNCIDNPSQSPATPNAPMLPPLPRDNLRPSPADRRCAPASMRCIYFNSGGHRQSLDCKILFLPILSRNKSPQYWIYTVNLQRFCRTTVQYSSARTFAEAFRIRRHFEGKLKSIVGTPLSRFGDVPIHRVRTRRGWNPLAEKEENQPANTSTFENVLNFGELSFS
jgi:hypothetical protein